MQAKSQPKLCSTITAIHLMGRQRLTKVLMSEWTYTYMLQQSHVLANAQPTHLPGTRINYTQ